MGNKLSETLGSGVTSTSNPTAEEPPSTGPGVTRRRSSSGLGEAVRRRSSSSASSAGFEPARRRSSSNAASFYLTPEEREYAQSLYGLLWPKEKDYLDEAFLISLLSDYQVGPFMMKTFTKVFATARFRTSYEGFEDFLIQCTRTSSTATLNVLWKLAKSLVVSEDKYDWSSRLRRFCALLLVFSSEKDPASSEQALWESATELAGFYTLVVHRNDGTVDVEQDFNALQSAVHLYSPQAARPFQCLVATIFFRANETPSFHRYFAPSCSSESLLLPNLSNGFLAMTSESLQGAWKCLYTMTTDGISFNRIVHHVLGYDGPTVILIRTTHRASTNSSGQVDNRPVIFGVFCQERWRENNRFYGSPKNFLFTLSPHFRIYHSSAATDNHFQFLASSGFNLPHGLGFGGHLEGGFRLFIPDTLEKCTARASCTTYEPGKLVFSEDTDVNNIQFDIEHLEVWGSGGLEQIEAALQAQVQHRHNLADTIAKAQKVDKAHFFNNGFDREFLLPKTLIHQREMQDRVEEDYSSGGGSAGVIPDNKPYRRASGTNMTVDASVTSASSSEASSVKVPTTESSEKTPVASTITATAATAAEESVSSTEA